MKTETCKLYSRAFWIFLPNIIKIDLYNFELYRLKVGPVFETRCISICSAARVVRTPGSIYTSVYENTVSQHDSHCNMYSHTVTHHCLMTAT